MAHGVFFTFFPNADSIILDSCVPSCSQYDHDCRLSQFMDTELDEEVRKRLLRGPWAANEAYAIINMATDILNGKLKNGGHYQNKVEELLLLLTGEENPKMELSRDTSRAIDADWDWLVVWVVWFGLFGLV